MIKSALQKSHALVVLSDEVGSIRANIDGANKRRPYFSSCLVVRGSSGTVAPDSGTDATVRLRYLRLCRSGRQAVERRRLQELAVTAQSGQSASNLIARILAGVRGCGAKSIHLRRQIRHGREHPGSCHYHHSVGYSVALP